MRRVFALVVLGIVLLVGAPYAALVMNRVMGSWTADAIEADGSVTHMEFGADLPRPIWVPVPPDASIVQSSRLLSRDAPEGVGRIEVAVTGSFDEIKQFYRQALEQSGFTVTDLGLGPLDPATARYLGVAGMLWAERPATGDQINVQIRTPEGVLLRSTLVEASWRKAKDDGGQRRGG
jgi:hypothetical protein